MSRTKVVHELKSSIVVTPGPLPPGRLAGLRCKRVSLVSFLPGGVSC